MRFIILIVIACLFLFISWIPPGNIQLAWDSNEEPEVIGYNLYTRNHEDEEHRHLLKILEEDLDDPLFPTVWVYDLDLEQKHYFVVTAFSDTQESGFSNEIMWEYKPEPEPEPEPEPPVEEPPVIEPEPTPVPPPAPVPAPKPKKKKKSNNSGCFISTLLNEDDL